MDLRHGDCLDELAALDSGIADLAYLDPPFFTQKVHQLAPRDRSCTFSFADVWRSQQEYVEFLHPRIKAVHRVLSDRGSIFFHCDRNAVHLVRLLLDEIFGTDNFRSEIIWHYRRWSNSRKGLLPTHQTILYYTRSDDYIFHEMLTEYSPATNVDQILQRRSRDEFNKSVYDRDEAGNTIAGKAKRGVPLGDVWDIPYLNPKARERTGYPTQKPLLLLERIIELATDPGSLVLDPFCGSGTTLVAAQHLGRNGIGIDTSADAVALARRRLKSAIRSSSQVMTRGRDAYRNADNSVHGLLHELDCVIVQRNRGIDAILKQTFAGGPVPVRVQRPGETVLEAANLLSRAAAGKQASVMFLVVTTRSQALPFPEELPEGVIAVESPAASIRYHLAALAAGVP